MEPRTQTRHFSVNDEVITIKSRTKYWRNNFQGFTVWVNDEKYHAALLSRVEAEDTAFVKWMKQHH